MVKEDDRIELIETDDPYTQLEQRSDRNTDTGAKGTVIGIDYDPPSVTPSNKPVKKIWVNWDNGGKLALIVGKDKFEVLEE